MKLAIVDREKCKPEACNQECKKYCPIEKKEENSCIVVEDKAKINEETCIGCGICERKCPFGAIKIVNVPDVKGMRMIHRYLPNGFALYGIPVPKEDSVLGLLGRNGIGKSTSIKILSGQEEMNFGGEERNVLEVFRGSELMNYFSDLKKKKIAYKPQDLSVLSKKVKVRDVLLNRMSEDELNKVASLLGIEGFIDNFLNELSGGELQKVAIAAASGGESDIYFFDEPLAYLDIQERIKIAEFIKQKLGDKTKVVVDHDLLIMDYLVDAVQIFSGKPGAFGIVSSVKSVNYGVNAYLSGYLKEENLLIRNKELRFDFTKIKPAFGQRVMQWPDFEIEYDSGFKLKAKGGELFENQIIGLLGKNGIGKTSFIKAIAGLIETNAGKIAGKMNISYKPQYLRGDSEKMVGEIVLAERIPTKIQVAFNLEMLKRKRVCELSGGELQRLEIARCLAKEADIYLFDEPSAYLDVEDRIFVAKFIRDFIFEKGKSAFVIDHDLLLMSYVVDSAINFSGVPAKEGYADECKDMEEGIGILARELDITLRKDKESGRPKINKKGSVMDREQREKGEWVEF